MNKRLGRRLRSTIVVILTAACLLTSDMSAWTGMASGVQTAYGKTKKAKGLKKKPKIENFKYYKSGKKIKAVFTVVDPDHTVKGGTVKVTGNKKVKKSHKKIKAGKNVITLKGLKKGKKCKVKVSIKYDRDGKKRVKKGDGTLVLKTKKVVNKKFTATLGVMTAAVDRQSSSAVLTFTGKAAPKGVIKGVVIGGKDYKAARSGAGYTVTVPCELDKKQSFKITNVVLSNYMQVKATSNDTYIFKDKPSVSMGRTAYDKNAGQIVSSWALTDNDSTVSKVYASLKKNGAVIQTQNMTGAAAENVSFKLPAGDNAGTYAVEVAADYDIADGLSHVKETLASSEVRIAAENKPNVQPPNTNGPGMEEPTATPTAAKTSEPTDEPTEEPTMEPVTDTPAPTDTAKPTAAPTDTATPSDEPTDEPTAAPTDTATPSDEPTEAPTDEPTEAPTDEPTPSPTPEITDYQFTFENATLTSVDNAKQTAVISFESTNVSSYKVSKLVINDGKEDKTYTVTENTDNHYSVSVVLSSKSRTVLTVKEAILANDKHLAVAADKTGFVVFKNTPVADIFDVTYDSQGVKLNAAWSLTDSDNTVSKLYAVLKKDGVEAETKELAHTARTAQFSLSATDSAGTYVVEVYADYDAADGLTHVKTLLDSSEIKIADEIKISKATISNGYPKKGEAVDIILEIASNTDENISKAVINGTEYPAEKQTDGTYKVKYTAPDKAGKQTVIIDALKYGDTLAPTAYDAGSVDVLKTAPTVSGLAYSDADGKRIVTFKLNDADHAFVSGALTLADEAGAVKDTKDLAADTTDYSFEVLKDTDANGRYHAKVSVKYDLDSDTANQKNEETKDLQEADFDIIVDYQFTFAEASLKSADYEARTAAISFKSTNASTHPVTKVKINGEGYTDITKDEKDPSLHTVNIALDSNDKTTLTVEEAVLENGKRFSIEPEKTGFIIFKKAPVAEIKDIVAAEGKITAAYSIKDPDSTISDYKIVLLGADGVQVAEKSKTDLASKLDGTVTFDNLEPGIYKMEIVADYDAVDGTEPKKGEILTTADDILYAITVDIKESTLSAAYSEKGKSIDISYNITTNTKQTITALVINDVDYTVAKQEDGTYKVVYRTGSIAGYEDITVSAVKFGDVSVPAEHTDKVEILRSLPTAEIATDYTGDKMKLLVNVADTDEAVVSAKVDILQSNNADASLQDYVVKSQEVNVGETTVDLSSLEDKMHVAVVTVEYALGQNKEDATHKDKLIANKSFEVINDYKFTLSDMKISEIDNEAGTADISFVSSNRSSGYYISEVTINEKSYPVVKKDMVKAADETNGASWNYTVEVPCAEKTKQVLKLTGVTLDNGKKIVGLTGNEVTIFKTKPEVSDNVLTINKDTNDCKLNFNVKDDDKTITSLKAVLENAVGTKVQEVTLEAGQTSYNVDFSSFKNDIGQYTARILADYELVDGSTYTNVELATATAEVTIDIDNISATAEPYVAKGGQVKITCTLTDNVPYYVQSFEITSSADTDQPAKEYSVTKESDTDDTTVYSVNVPAPDKAGNVTYTLSKIHYIDEKDGQSTAYTAEVKDCSATVEVLKSAPVLDSYVLDETDNEFTFKLTDDDNAKTEMKVTATEKGTENKTELTAVQREGLYAVSIASLSKDKVYDIEIRVAYDLDTDPGNETNTGTVTMKNEIDLSISYAAKLTGMKVDKINTVDSKAEITINASVTADDKATDTVYVAQAVINGQTCELTKAQEKDTYTATVSYTGDSKQTIKVEKLILSNGLKFDCTANNTAEIFKAAPKAEGLTLTIAENKMSAAFTLTDADAVISSLKAVLYDEKGTELESKTIDDKKAGAKNVAFTHDVSKAGTYKVTVNADYERFDGVTHANEEMISEQKKVDISAVITSCTATPKYSTKGGDVKIEYAVTDNTDLEISGFVIDGTTYNIDSDKADPEATATPDAASTAAPAAASEAADGKYTITLKAPDTAGKKTYNTTAVVYAGDQKVEVAKHCTAQTEVLKATPTVDNYVVNEGENKISFSITDTDGAFISGKVTITAEGSETIDAYTIDKVGSHSFDIPEKVISDKEKTYTVHFILTYDLDEDQTPSGDNYKKDEDVRSQTLEFAAAADVYIDNVEVTNVNKEERSVEIEFTAANDDGENDDNHIRSIYINGEEYATEHNHETGVYTLKDRLKYEEDDGVKQTFVIDKALLGSGTELDMTEREVSFDIFREAPTVENLQVNVNEKKVSVDFRLQDINEDIDKAYVLLRRSVFNEVYGNTEIHEIDAEELTDPRTGEHHADLELQDIDDAYDFSVEVAADFDVADGEEHVQDVLLAQTGEVKIRSNILDDSLKSDEDLGGDIVDKIIEKKQKMRLAFEVTDNTELDATGMEINGETYTVYKDRPTDNGNIYLADVEAPDEAGEQGFKVTKIYYGNKESDIQYESGKRTILKEKPTLEGYTDGGFEEEPYLDFTFKDEDNTLDGDAILTITENEKSRLVKKTEKLEKDQHYHIDLKDYPDGMYTVSVTASYYDEEQKKKVENADLLEDDILHLKKRLQIKKGLGFKGSLIAPTVFYEDWPFMFGLTVDSIKEELKDENESGDLITGFKLAKVRENDDGTYEKTESYVCNPSGGEFNPNCFVAFNESYNGFVMGWTLDSGYTYVYYESVFLSDGTEVALDWYSNYSILKSFPEVTKTTLKEDIKANTVTATTDISDPDKTINRLRLRLMANNGRVLAEKYLNRSELDGKLKAADAASTATTITEVFDSTQMPMTNRYKLDVMLEFDAMGQGEYMVQTLGSASVNSAERVVIRNHKVLNPYPKKGEKVTLEYNIADNLSSGIDIIGAVINGQQVEVSSSSGDNYQFEVDAPMESGVHDFTATAIVLSNKNYNLEKKEAETEEESYNFQPTDTVDVLKTAPYVTGCKLTDDPNNDTAQFEFTLVDPDEALTKDNVGVATVGTAEEKLVAGKNTVKFDSLQEEEMLSMDVLANFKLDSGELPDADETEAAKNTHTKESVLDKPVEFMILKDYELSVSELKSLGADDTEATDFEKGVSVGLTFNSANKANIPIKQVVVGEDTYDVEREEDGSYMARVKGYTAAGKHKISVDKVILENGKTISDIKNKETVEVEVLKDVVSVEKLKYKTNAARSNETMTLSINVNDADNSLVGQTLDVTVKDKASGEVVKQQSIAPNTTTDVTFSTGEGKKFDIDVKADYKRTVDDENVMNDQVIYKKTVSKESRTIEMKAIQDVKLYKMENGTQTAVETVGKDEITEANMKNYTVRVDMKNMPAFYSVLEGIEKKEDKLILKISYEGAVDYSSEEPNKENIEIEFVPVENDRFAYDGSFAMLLERMRRNPTDTYKLTKDYDASTYTTDALTYFGPTEFKGTLDGNGFTISNLSKPLFETLNGATIQNLYIMNAQITTKDKEYAVLSHKASSVKVNNVFMDTINISASMDGTPVAGMFLNVNGASEIKESSITNLMVTGCYLLQRAGAFASSFSGSKLINCYAQGVINSGYQGDGGLVGTTDKTSSIENCISNQSLTPYFGLGSGYSHLNGGNIVGVANEVTLKNNIAIADRNNAYAYKIYNGTGKLNTASENNYYLSDTPGIPNEDTTAITAIDSTQLNEEFYKNKLKLDENIWNLTGASAENVPTLKNNRLTSPYIPSYERIKDIAKYDATKEVAYNNLYKLTPFYDAAYVIEDAAQINTGDTLNTKKIQGIIPYNGDDKVVYALDTRNYDQIKKIRLMFTDGTSTTYNVTYDITLGDVACYDIPELNLKYTYNHYIVNADSPFIDELVNELYNAGDYATALDPITPNKDPFTYSWYYNEEIRKKEVLKEFVIKVVANSGYSVTTGNSVINTAIREELTKDNKLLKMLYAYTYYMRWYNFDIGEFNMADMIMFKGDIFSDIMTFEALVDTLLSNPGDTMRTGATDEYYSKYLSAFTGIAKLPDFLNMFIVMTGKYDNVNDWFTEHFTGELIEVEMDRIPDVDIAYDKIKYRAWEHLSARPNLMLPFIMIPEDGAYIISLPTIMAFGSQKTYVRDIEKDKEKFRASMESWANALKTYYNMFLGILSGGDQETISVVDRFNARDDYINDTVAIYENPEDPGRTEVNLQTTKDVYYKWFGEPTGKAYFHPGNYAAANGKDIFYAKGDFFGNMILFAHECAHNHDGTLYFKGTGRRAGTGAETFTTGFFTQSFTEGSPQLNGYYRWGDDTKVANNLTPERINSTAKIDDFYKKAFETSYLLDYLAGEVFLKLNAEQQAAIASIAPDGASAGRSSIMQRVTKAEIEEMNLQKVDDLIDHRIDLTNSISGGQSMYAIRWYETHSASSVVSDDVFHYMAYQMLGYAGYDNGFIQYCGKIHDNDITALTEISKLTNSEDNYKSFDEFKKGEFKKVEAKKDKISYINLEEVKKEFEEAMKKDAEAKDRGAYNTRKVKEKYYQILKQNTDDFRGEIFQEKKSEVTETKVSTAEEFAETAVKDKYATIVLEKDIDFADFDSNGAIVGATFLGTVKGNDKKISNLSVPLFKRLGDGAKIENLKIEDASLSIDYAGAGILAKYTEGAEISGVSLERATIETTNKSMIGGLIGSATATKMTDVSVKDVTIHGFREIGGAVGTLTDSTIKGGSVENATITSPDDCIGGFVGLMTDSQVSDVTSISAKVEGRRNVGGLAGQLTSTSTTKSTGEPAEIASEPAAGAQGDPAAAEGEQADTSNKRSVVKNSSSVYADVHGNTRVGGLIGFAEKYSIIRTSSTANAKVKSDGNCAGGFVGEIADTDITDCYALDADVYGKQFSGGFVGYAKSSEIKNCYSTGKVGGSQKEFGGFIGTLNTSGKVENCLAAADVEGTTSAYKFDSCTSSSLIKEGYKNNYEVKEKQGSSARNGDKEYIKETEESKLKEESFYTSQLQWNKEQESNIWDFSGVTSGGFPKLKGSNVDANGDVKGDAQTQKAKHPKAEPAVPES